MRFGVFASVLLHFAAFGLAFLSLPESWRSKIVSEPIVPIEIIAQAELAEKTSVPAAAPKQPEPPKPEPAPPKEEPKPEPPKPKVEEKKPEPVAEPAPPKPEPKAEEKKPEPPKPKPKPKEEELDLNRLAAVIDKAKKEESSQKPPADAPLEAERAREAIGAGDRLTASDKAKMQAAVGRCWSVTALAGAPDANKLVVVLQFELNRDGTIAGAPRVANATQINLSGNRFWKVAEQTAIRALMSCQPYDFLSQDRYADWRQWEIGFDPSVMAGY